MAQQHRLPTLTLKQSHAGAVSSGAALLCLLPPSGTRTPSRQRLQQQTRMSFKTSACARKAEFERKIDVASRTSSSAVRLREAKASGTAPLTRNQAKAHPEIANSGATVIGKGKPGFPGGTKLLPTKVEIVRPKER